MSVKDAKLPRHDLVCARGQSKKGIRLALIQ